MKGIERFVAEARDIAEGYISSGMGQLPLALYTIDSSYGNGKGIFVVQTMVRACDVELAIDNIGYYSKTMIIGARKEARHDEV